MSKSLQESEQIVRDQNEEIIQLNARSSEEKDQFVSEIESLKIKCSEMEIQLADSTQTKTIEVLQKELSFIHNYNCLVLKILDVMYHIYFKNVNAQNDL